MKEKIALFCNVKKEDVIQNKTVDILYEVPLMLEEQGMAVRICKKLNLEKQEANNENWQKMIERIKRLENKNIKIAIVGKYMQLDDAYLSLIEAISSLSSSPSSWVSSSVWLVYSVCW